MKRTRVQFDFSREALEHLNELQSKVDASTRAEVIKNALWVYEWLVERAEEGRGVRLSSSDLRHLTRFVQKKRASV